MLIGATKVSHEVEFGNGEGMSFLEYANAASAAQILTRAKSPEDLYCQVFWWKGDVDWWDISAIVKFLRHTHARKAEESLRKYLSAGSFYCVVNTRRPAEELPTALEDTPEQLWGCQNWTFSHGNWRKADGKIHVWVEYTNSPWEWKEGHAGNTGPFEAEVSWEKFIQFAKR